MNQQAIDEAQVRTARYYELLAQAGAEKAQVELAYTRSQSQVPEMATQTAQLALRRAQNAMRPCVFWGAKLEDGGEHWVARYGQLAVRGETAEMAMENFDRAWALGDRDYLVETDGDDDVLTSR